MTDIASMEALTDGQVYRWQWRDRMGDQSLAYWCKSRIAVVRNGRLFDTYWHGEQHQVDPLKVTLELLCDETWPQIKTYEVAYYDGTDVVDTRHANDSHAPIYLRPGAQRSADAILEEISRREDAVRSEIQSATWKLERLTQQRALLASGRADELML